MYECMHRPFIIPTLRHPPQPPDALVVAATEAPRRDSACDTHEALQHNCHPTTVQPSHVAAVCNAQDECNSLSSSVQLQQEHEACTQDEMTHSGIASPPAEAVSNTIFVSGHRGRDEEEAAMRGSGGATGDVHDGVACRNEGHTLPAHVSHDRRSGEAVEDDESGHVQRTQARLQQPHYLPPLSPPPQPAMPSPSIAHPFTTATTNTQCHAGQHTRSGLFTSSLLSHSDEEDEDDSVRRADATSVATHHRVSGDADTHAERQTVATPSTQTLSLASLRLMAHVTYRGTLLRRSFALWWRVSLARRRRRRQRERFAAFFYGERLCFVAFRAWQWRCALRWRLARLRQSVQAEHCLWQQRRVLRAWHASVQQRHRQRDVVKNLETVCTQRCRRVYWHRWLLWQRQCVGLRALQCAVKQSHQACILRRWCAWLRRRQYNTMCMMVLTLHTPAAWSMTSTTTSVTLTVMRANGLLREENMTHWSLREWCMMQCNNSSSATQAGSIASHGASPPQLALCSRHHCCTSTPAAAVTKHTMSSLTCAATGNLSLIHNGTTTAIGKGCDGTLCAMSTRVFLAHHVWLQWLRVTWARRGQRLHRHATLLSELQRRTGQQRHLLTWRTWLLFTMVALRRRRVQRTLGQHYLSRWMRWSALERQCRTLQQRQVQQLGAQCLIRWQARMHIRRVQHTMHNKAMRYYTETWCVHEARRVLHRWHERLITRSSHRAMRDDAETLRHTLLRHIALRRLIERVMTSTLASRSAAEATSTTTTTTISNTRDVWPVMAQEQSSQRGSGDSSNTTSAENVVTKPLQTAWHTTRLPSPIPLHTLSHEGESAKTTQEHIAYKDHAAAALVMRVRGKAEHARATRGQGMTCPECHTALMQPRIQARTRRQGRPRQGMAHSAIHVCARCAEEREEDDGYRSDEEDGVVMRVRRHTQGDAMTQTYCTPTQSSPQQEQHYERQGTTCDGRASNMRTSRTTTTAVARRTRMSDADTQTDIQDTADDEARGSNKIAIKNTAACATETVPLPPSSSAMSTHGMTHESTALPPLIAHDAEKMSRVSNSTDGAAQPRIVYVPLCLAPPTGQEDNNNSPTTVTTTSHLHPCTSCTVTKLPCSSPNTAAVRQAPLPQPRTATEAMAANTSCHAALAPAFAPTLSLSPPAVHNAALSKAVREMPAEAQVRAYLQALAQQGTLLPCASHARCGFDLHKHVDPCAPLPTVHTDTTTQPSESAAHTAPLVTSSPSLQVQQQQQQPCDVNFVVATSAVGQDMSPAPPLTRTDSIHASPCAIVTGIQRTQPAVPQQAGQGGHAAQDNRRISTSPGEQLLPHNGDDAVVEDAEELSSVHVLSELSELDGVGLVQQGRQLLQQYKLLKRLAPAHEAELRTIEQQLHSPSSSSTTAASVASMQALQARQARLLYYRAQRTRLRSAVEQLAMRLQDRLGVHLSFSDTASEH